MAKIIDGKAISKQVLTQIANQIKELQIQKPTFKPGLAVVQVNKVVVYTAKIDLMFKLFKIDLD